MSNPRYIRPLKDTIFRAFPNDTAAEIGRVTVENSKPLQIMREENGWAQVSVDGGKTIRYLPLYQCEFAEAPAPALHPIIGELLGAVAQPGSALAQQVYGEGGPPPPMPSLRGLNIAQRMEIEVLHERDPRKAVERAAAMQQQDPRIAERVKEQDQRRAQQDEKQAQREAQPRFADLLRAATRTE